jgi:hypothetical protein
MKETLRNNDDVMECMFRLTKMIEDVGPVDIEAVASNGDIAQTRSNQQNKLAFRWYKHLSKARQDETPEFYRALCKLEIGVPILREDDSFREKYDSKVKPYPYDKKLEFMGEPFDFPVTRIMSIKEFHRYLEEMERKWAERGTVLPRPDDLYFEAMGIKRNV